MLISIIVTLVIIGLVAWLISFLPLPSPFMQIIHVILVIVAILYVLSAVTGHSFFPLN